MPARVPIEWIERGKTALPDDKLMSTDDVIHLMKVALRLAEDGLEYGEVGITRKVVAGKYFSFMFSMSADSISKHGNLFPVVQICMAFLLSLRFAYHHYTLFYGRYLLAA